MPSMLIGESSASAYSDCNGALDVDSRSTTEAMTDETLLPEVQRNLPRTTPKQLQWHITIGAAGSDCPLLPAACDK